MAPTSFTPPSFDTLPLVSAPEATFVAAPADGVLPDGFFATTNLPTYVKHAGAWKLPREPRMDGALVLDDAGTIWVREGRRVHAGDLVAVGREEDGSRGIYVHTHGFHRPSSANEFSFMSTLVSRERPIDYPQMARLLIQERDRSGYIVWVVGPAIVHARARAEFVWFVEHGFVDVLLAGNAVAVHDIETSIFGTSLGVPESGDEPAAGGHSLHLRAINKVRAAGSIEAAVTAGLIRDGIMYSCVREQVPFVLCGSIRDDGPLPEVISDVLAAQDAMRQHAKKATMAVMIATALHAIATGNMLPAFVESDGALRELPTICVDSSEFVVSKLKDRGTHQAFGVVTNAQDFLHILRSEIEDQLALADGAR